MSERARKGTRHTPALRDKRDMPLAFVPLCPAHELRRRDATGQMSRSVTLCPAASRGSPASRTSRPKSSTASWLYTRRADLARFSRLRGSASVLAVKRRSSTLARHGLTGIAPPASSEIEKTYDLY